MSIFFDYDVTLAFAIITVTSALFFVVLPFLARDQQRGRIKPGPRKNNKFSRQSYDVAPPEALGEGPIRRASDLKPDEELYDSLKDTENNLVVATLCQNFARSERLFGNCRCLGTRRFESDGTRGPYEFRTYKEIAALARYFGSGLKNLGAKRGEHIGIYSKNREEWVIADQACSAYSLTIIALYDTLGENAVAYIASHASTRFVVVSRESLRPLMGAAPDCPELKTIVLMEEPTDEERLAAEAINLRLLGFQDVVQDGKSRPVTIDPPTPDDLYSIMYTSGTTGDPKGVLLTHRNVMAMMAAVNQRVAKSVATPEDAYLSYLPLAHIFERAIMQCAFSRGTRVGFYQGSVLHIIDDVQELKPSFFVGVPRVYDKIYGKIVNLLPQQQGKMRWWLFRRAVASMEKTLKTGKESDLWKWLVLNKARKRLGGNVRAMLSGGAPLTPVVHKFLTCVFGCTIVQGYGLTETCAGATAGYLEDPSFGHVGAPMPCCEIKLVAVDDMPEYDPNGETPCGEVVIRGPNVSPGYYRDTEKTAESFRNGWFYTGDIGRWNPDGTLSIIDRKKNIFKLSHGEYIAVEKLEGAFTKSKFVSQIWVYGDSNKAHLVAVVYPDPDALIPWAQSQNIPLTGDRAADFLTVCSDERAANAVAQDLRQVAKATKLRGFEVVERVYLTPEEFTPANDLVTPTFKLKRPQLKKHFNHQIESMYASIPA